MTALTIGNMTEDEVGMLVAVLMGAEDMENLADLDVDAWTFQLSEGADA